jgi:hypothetical protein
MRNAYKSLVVKFEGKRAVGRFSPICDVVLLVVTSGLEERFHFHREHVTLRNNHG